MEKSILDFWSHPSNPPRKSQVTALEWIEKQTAKYIILELPVGAGKSHVGVTLSRYLSNGNGNAFILTPQRILQKQYEKSFDPKTVASLYGKSNYPCVGHNTTCDIGSLFKPKCPTCPHTLAKNAAKSSPNVVLNYKLAMLSWQHTETFGKRKLMVLDECHVLEQEITEFDAVTISYKRCEKYKIPWKRCQTIESAIKWIESSYLPFLRNALIELQDELSDIIENQRNASHAEVKRLREMNALEEHIDGIDNILMMSNKDINEHYVLVHDKMMMKFKRLSGAYGFKNMFNPMAERFLFMSATILDYKGFCNDLGIDPKDAVFLSLDSEFDADNRPVMYSPQMKMNASWVNEENAGGRKRMLNKIKEITNFCKDDSGIIHTANFQVAKWLVEQLDGKIPHDILHHNPESGDDRNDIIDEFHKCKKPTILISPSITEGLDLVDDLARFAIVAKVPFGNLGDQWIKRRQEMSQAWYSRQALIEILQGGGRVVRSVDDWGHVFILDASWGYLFSQTKRLIPEWWLDSYLVEDD